MRNFKKLMIVGTVATTVILGGLTGCATWGGGDSQRSAGRIVDDKQITAQVKDRLSDEPVYKFEGVQVNTFSGLVQLSGFATSEQQKQRAAQVAESVPGVVRVVNNITLKPETPTPTGRTEGANPQTQHQENPPPAEQERDQNQ